MAKSIEKINFRMISFDEWRRGIQPLWEWIENPDWIPIANNPYGVLQYSGRETFERTLYFPIAAFLDERPIAWTMTYNISDTSVRLRGVYVLPEYRGQGIGPKLCGAALALWPKPWFRYLGFWKEDVFPAMEKKWGLRRVPGFEARRRIIIPGQQAADYKIIFAYKDFR